MPSKARNVSSITFSTLFGSTTNWSSLNEPHNTARLNGTIFNFIFCDNMANFIIYCTRDSDLIPLIGLVYFWYMLHFCKWNRPPPCFKSGQNWTLESNLVRRHSSGSPRGFPQFTWLDFKYHYSYCIKFRVSVIVFASAK